MIITSDVDGKPAKITMIRPFDGHVHLREYPMLESLVEFATERFIGSVVMPNLARPIRTVGEVQEYCRNILDIVIPNGSSFRPYMTIFLTEATTKGCVAEVAKSRNIVAFKLYPKGVTTNSETGVTDIEKVYPVLGAMERQGVPLLVHGEVNELKGKEVDMFDRETAFIDTVLDPLVRRFPNLKISLEHISTKEGILFVKDASPRIVGTITPHHLLLSRNDLFRGGLRPHHFCLPVLKREEDRHALIEAATSGNPKFFLGTDSAPHERYRKEADGGCGGTFSAHAALELCAKVFEQEGKLENLEKFAALNGPNFYDLQIRRTEMTVLSRSPWTVPDEYWLKRSAYGPKLAREKIFAFFESKHFMLPIDGEIVLVPLWAGGTLQWRILS